MNRFSRLGLALGAAIALLGLAVAAHAVPVNQTITTYYSDKTLTTEVGTFTLACNGQQKRTGTTSKFSVKQSIPCNPSTTPPPGGCTCYLDGRLATCPPHACD